MGSGQQSKERDPSAAAAAADNADHGLDPYYRFLTAARPSREVRADRGAGGLTVSLAAHVVLFILVGLVLGRAPASAPQEGRPTVTVPLVWRPIEGGGGQKGGGGEGEKKPAAMVRLVGHDAITVPAAPPRSFDSPTPPQEPDPTPRLEIPAVPLASGVQEVAGAVTELRPIEFQTRGPGSGPGADGGRGSGQGERDGGRIGNEDGGPGRGGEGVKPGNGVSWPRLVQEVKPNYTPDAMRAQVEGLVELEILVLADGSVGRVNIIRSLDARFGLDEEAVKAVRRWRFDPGRQLGKAVATRVGVELSFNLR